MVRRLLLLCIPLVLAGCTNVGGGFVGVPPFFGVGFVTFGGGSDKPPDCGPKQSDGSVPATADKACH